FIIIAILGLALGESFSGSPRLSKYDVAVVDKDKGEIAKLFIDKTLKSDDLSKLLKVTKKTEDEARKLVSMGDLAAGIIIPKGFSEKIKRGEGGKLEVIGDPGQKIRAAIVEGITRSFARRVSAVTIGVKTPLNILVESKAISPLELPATTGLLTKEARSAVTKPFIRVQEETKAAERGLSAIQYYSAGMAVMFILFSAMFGAVSLIDERHNMTLARLLTTPSRNSSILGGKLVGVFFIGILQFSALVLATRLMFGVQWGNSLPGLVVLVVSTVLASTGMSIFIAAAAKTTKAAAAMSQVLIQGMAALGGSMVPLQAFPDWLKNISQFTINYWAMNGFTQLMDGKSFEVIILPSIILLSFCVIFLSLGIWRFRFE
ncbi:MAG TPA: ABC transporter permease, partial [Candidatus Subteraquimicrobiales bacterium]